MPTPVDGQVHSDPVAAGGFHKGTENVTVSAEDIGGGVQSIVLSADGQTLQTTTHLRLHLRTTLPPIDLTTNLHPADHEPHRRYALLTLVAIDAAGNQSTVASKQIVVDNDPPPPPTELTATPTQTGSSTFTVTWTDSSDQVAPIAAATYQVCPATAPQTCSPPATAPPEGPVSVSVPGPGTWTLTVWLTNAAANSNPANAAETTLTVPPALREGQAPGAGQLRKRRLKRRQPGRWRLG
jgi:hypothetical protein